MKEKKLYTFFGLLFAAILITLGVTGCGKKEKAQSLPELDVKNPKSVMLYYAACCANGQYEKAAGVAVKDGLEIVNTLKSQPDSKQSKEIIAAFRTITDSPDNALSDTDQKDAHHYTYKFNVKPIKKIGVKMEGGKYWVFDL